MGGQGKNHPEYQGFAITRLAAVLTLRDVSYNARWFWTTIRYGPMTTAYLCWTTDNGF